MADKIIKAPGIFKKPIKKQKWEKKYLSKLYLPEDQKFLKSLAKEEDGKIHINVVGLGKKDLKKLKKLGKIIKSNRKSLNFIIIFIFVILAAGGVLFELYLKNRLVKNLIENQLEGIFMAQADLGTVDLSVLKGDLIVDYLAVANYEKPMKNLFECSTVKAAMDTAELLQGRVVIESLGFEGLKRNTDRAESGELIVEKKDSAAVNEAQDAASSGEVSSGEGSSGEGSGLFAEGKNAVSDAVNQLGALAGNIDVEALLAEQKDKLESFKAIDQSKQEIESYAENWEKRAAEWEDEISEWQGTIDYVVKVNPDSFSSIEGARTTISRLEGIYKDAENDYLSIQKDLSAAEAQFNEASSMYDNIREAINADFDYIESLVTIPEGNKADWVASILEEKLSMPVGKYLGYLDKGMLWYERFKRLKDQKEEKSPAQRRPGRKLPPPVASPPGFVLKHAFASGEEPELVYGLDLYNLVSEPDKWNGETRLELEADMPATGAATAIITEKSLEVDIPKAPFDFGSQLSAIDIAYLGGSLNLQSEVVVDDSGFEGAIFLASDDITTEPVKTDSIIYRLIDKTIESVKPVSASGSFVFSKDGESDFSIDTELDEKLSGAASELLKEGADEGLKMLREYLDAELAGPLSEFDSAKDELKKYTDMIENYEDELAEYRTMADDKIAEIEQAVKDNISSQAEQLIKDVVPEDLVPTDSVNDAADKLKSTFGSKLNF